MRLFFIGCEYAGTTTLAVAIRQWAKEEMGIDLGPLHDHWKIPDVVGHYPNTLTEKEYQQFLALSTRVTESFMRHNLYYHTPHERSGRFSDQIIIGHYIEDTIYASLYYNYGGPGQAGDRAVHSKGIEDIVVNLEPQTVLVLVKASPEVIARRMKEVPHPHGVVQEADIERVSRLFEAAFDASRLSNKMVLDTSTATVEETLAQFVSQMEPFLTDADRQRNH